MQDKINELISHIPACTGDEVREMTDDIFYYFSQLEQFEVLRIERSKDASRMVLAACVSTMEDPFFKIVVAHTWQKDLAYDNEWHEFDTTEMGTVFRFLTWEDEYISGEIWFDRSKPEITE